MAKTSSRGFRSGGKRSSRLIFDQANEHRNSPTPNLSRDSTANAAVPLKPEELAQAIQNAFAQKATSDGWVNLASVGATLKKLVPGFEAWHYGYEKLSHLLRNCGLVDIRQDGSRFPPTYMGKFKEGATISNIRPPLPAASENAAERRPTSPPPPVGGYVRQPHPRNSAVTSEHPANPLTGSQQMATEAYFSRQPRWPGQYLYSWSAIFGKDIEALAELALRETWEFGGSHNPDRPFPILESYLRYTFYSLWIEKKVLVRGNLSAFNTGLVDRRYEPIFAMFTKNERGSRPWHLMGFCIAGEDNLGKQLVWHFKPLPEPPHYFQNANYMFYDVSASPPSVDWEHVIVENLERLPVEFLEDNCPRNFEMKDTRKMNQDESKRFYDAFAKAVQDDLRTYRMLKSRLDAAVELALKRVRWNFKTAIPVYFPTNNRMNMLLPLALVSDEVIDIALVVEKTDSGNYLGHTILPLDWAYNNARLVCRPNSEWLSPDLINQSAVKSDADAVDVE